MLHHPGNKALYPCETGSESGEIGETSQVRHQTSPRNVGSFFVPWMQSHRIHIYLHLVECCGECRYCKYTIQGSYGNLCFFIWQSSRWWAVFSLTKCETTSWVAKTLFHNMFFHPASPRGVFHQLWMMSFHLYVLLSLKHLQKDCCSLEMHRPDMAMVLNDDNDKNNMPLETRHQALNCSHILGLQEWNNCQIFLCESFPTTDDVCFPLFVCSTNMACEFRYILYSG